MTTAETVTLSWSPDPKIAGAQPAGSGSGAATPSLVIPSRLGSVRLIRELGHGGMGVVWLGHHEFLDRQVAVKFLLATVTDRDDPRFQVFLDGARAAAQVRHLGLTAVLHADIVENVPYLVMEYVSGPTLADLIERTGPLRVPALLAVLERIADALDKLHEAGVIHRDIKPSNILVDVQGQAYLTDFGLACRVENRERIITSGTPEYMAPECFDGEASPRTDIYALAATAYHLLAGRAPYKGSVASLREQHKTGAFPPEHLHATAVPKAVIDMLQRAANADPRFRTKSCHKLLEAFREASGKSVTAAAGVDQLARLVGALKACATDVPATLVSALAGSPNPTTPGAPIATTGSRTFEAEGAMLAEPVPCVQCGYELRGLPVTARCPECQRPIEHSLRPDRLIFADPAWLARVNLGLWLMSGAVGITACVFLGLAITRVVNDTLTPRLPLWGAFASIATLFALPAAYVLAARPEPGERARSPYRPMHWAVGVIMSLIAMILIAFYLEQIWKWPGSNTESRRGLLVWAVVAVAVCSLPAYICASIGRLLGRGPSGRVRWIDAAATLAAWSGLAVAASVTFFELSKVVLSDHGAGSGRLGIGFVFVAAFGALPQTLALSVFALRLRSARKQLLTPSVATSPGSDKPTGKSSTYYQSLSTLADRRRVNAPALTPEPAQAEPPAPSGVLSASVGCVSCGRDLKDAHVNDTCPGCASPIRASLDPARLVFAPRSSLERASRGLDRASLTLLVGLLLLAVTAPFQVLVKSAAGTLSLVYAPFWLAVTAVALDGCRVGVAWLGLPVDDRGPARWRVTFWLVALGTLALQIGYGMWLGLSGAYRSSGEGADSLGWPSIVLLVPTLAVPVALAGLALVIRRGGNHKSGNAIARIAALLPIGALGVAYLMLNARSSLSAGAGLAIFAFLLLTSIPAACIGLKLASKQFRAAAEAAVSYRKVSSALDSAGLSGSPPTGGATSQPT